MYHRSTNPNKNISFPGTVLTFGEPVIPMIKIRILNASVRVHVKVYVRIHVKVYVIVHAWPT